MVGGVEVYSLYITTLTQVQVSLPCLGCWLNWRKEKQRTDVIRVKNNI